MVRLRRADYSHLLSAALQTAKNYLLHNKDKIAKQKYIKKYLLNLILNHGKNRPSNMCQFGKCDKFGSRTYQAFQMVNCKLKIEKKNYQKKIM